MREGSGLPLAMSLSRPGQLAERPKELDRLEQGFAGTLASILGQASIRLFCNVVRVSSLVNNRHRRRLAGSAGMLDLLPAGPEHFLPRHDGTEAQQQWLLQAQQVQGKPLQHHFASAEPALHAAKFRLLNPKLLHCRSWNLLP